MPSASVRAVPLAAVLAGVFGLWAVTASQAASGTGGLAAACGWPAHGPVADPEQASDRTDAMTGLSTALVAFGLLALVGPSVGAHPPACCGRRAGDRRRGLAVTLCTTLCTVIGVVFRAVILFRAHHGCRYRRAVGAGRRGCGWRRWVSMLASSRSASGPTPR
jgi:hypothetical protein